MYRYIFTWSKYFFLFRALFIFKIYLTRLLWIGSVEHILVVS